MKLDGLQADGKDYRRTSRFSGGVAQGAGEASFREAFLPEDAAIAESAGSTFGTRLVAGPREREIHAQGMAGPDNLGLGHPDQGCVNLEPAPAFHAGLRGQVRHLLEGLDVLGTAIWVPGVIEDVGSEEHVLSAEDLGPAQRVGENDR